MKWLAAALLFLASSAMGADFEQHFSRVVHIKGAITFVTPFSFEYELMQAQQQPDGPLLILISSEGGSEESGYAIIKLIEAQKKERKVYCMVLDYAHSMAFNILTHCDVRTASKDAKFLIHKIAGFPGNLRPTAKNLHRYAKELERCDVRYDVPNAKAMHIPLSTYCRAAERETMWTAARLKKLKYLHGLAEFIPDAKHK